MKAKKTCNVGLDIDFIGCSIKLHSHERQAKLENYDKIIIEEELFKIVRVAGQILWDEKTE